MNSYAHLGYTEKEICINNPASSCGWLKENNMFIDQYFLLLVLPAMALSMYAQFKVKSTFAKYSKIRSSKNMNGRDAAMLILKTNSINDVAVESVKGSLTDHYDPRDKTLRLSEPVYAQPSIAALGVAAHEAGHAIQHARGYGPLVLRSTLVPTANIGSRFGPIMAMGGLFMTWYMENPIGMLIFNIGIVLFTVAVAFYLITLPVEFNASSRALANLRDSNVLTQQELEGAKKVLSAAAMTYVASALTAIMSLLRLILIARSRR